MSDDKNDRGARDRSQVAASEPYELEYFAKKHGITLEQARTLVETHGNDRAVLDEAAARMRSS